VNTKNFLLLLLWLVFCDQDIEQTTRTWDLLWIYFFVGKICVHSDPLALHCIVCCDDYLTPAGVGADESATMSETETVTRSVPLLLDCGHTLCHACVEHLAFGPHQVATTTNNRDEVGGGMVSCPVCRLMTKAFNSEDVTTILIPKNDALIAIINQLLVRGHGEGEEGNNAKTSQAIAVHCGNCEEGQVQTATVRCIPCAIYFCDECFNCLHGGKVTLRLFIVEGLECI
jgi:hypothetical protein